MALRGSVWPTVGGEYVRSGAVCLALFVVMCASARGQGAPAPTAPLAAQAVEVPPDEADMTPDQKVRFSQAGQDFNANRFAEALTLFRKLYGERPGDGTLAKFLAESAINTGDAGLAIATLRPAEQRDPDDWQTVSILAHAYAQSGQGALRDAEVERLRTLYARGEPPLSTRRDFLLETVKAGDKTVRFFPAFAPWGPYGVHLIARVYDAAGQQVFRVTLESADFDQPLFAKQHPAEAAKGERQFSLDGYPPDERDANGRLVQTHMTYEFFAGQPPYDAVRERTLAVVAGRLKPVSSSKGVTGQ